MPKEDWIVTAQRQNPGTHCGATGRLYSEQRKKRLLGQIVNCTTEGSDRE